MIIMERAIALIKRHEGLRLHAYRCPAGVWTIGRGHTAGVRPGDRITAAEADALLAVDVAALYGRLAEMELAAGLTLGGNRRAALVSFAYNVGLAALRRSTLWRKVRRNPSDPSIAAEFARWKYAGGKALAGLVKRRAEEAALYFQP